MPTTNQSIALPKKMILIGFGSVGQAVLPLLVKHLQSSPSQWLIIAGDLSGEKMAKEYGITLRQAIITQENYKQLIGTVLDEGDVLLNLSIGISSVDLIQLCQLKGALYLDASTEPWEGFYLNEKLPLARRTNYWLREEVLTLKNNKGPTAVLTHGANPGLVSHFTKQALWNMAQDNGLKQSPPKDSAGWANLANQLQIKVIHIAERDTQIAAQAKVPGEFVNTWSADGFMSEAGQPAELGWGTHERHWPQDAYHHESGCKSAIYLAHPGAVTKVRTWTPMLGAFHGFLITHAEAISIAHYLTLYEHEKPVYRPTVHYAYLPCQDACLSLAEFVSNDWIQQKNKRLLLHEITHGTDELGVLLMGNKKGAYWYGSQLTIDDARKAVPYNNATSLQVASGVLAGVLWAIENPNRGVVEPEALDYQAILKIALPYLGKVGGVYTDWTPLQARCKLFPETVDKNDPWQFMNLRVFQN